MLAVAACGASPAAPVVGKTPVKISPQHANGIQPVDLLAALAEPDNFPHSFIVPGNAQLSLGGEQIQAPPAASELQVTIIDEQTEMVRVAVRIPGLAFAIWTERARLLGIAKKDQLIGEMVGGGFFDPSAEAPFAELRSGARVRMLERKQGWTKVRYLGSLEIDGWVPDGSLTDRTTEDHPPIGRMPTGLPTLLVTPGSVIRAEPKWASREIAVMANGYFLDTIKVLDDVWSQVGYEDGDIRVRGFVSRQDPPGRIHKPHEPDTAPAVINATGTIAKGACLYAAQHGEAIGYVVEDRSAEVSSGRSPGWYTVSVDTPWGPIMFAATGTSDHDLTACGPPLSAHP